VAYYVITLSIYMNARIRLAARFFAACWMVSGGCSPGHADPGERQSSISQARTRFGSDTMRRLYDEVVGPVATPASKDAWYKRWIVALLFRSRLAEKIGGLRRSTL
jgi:hypothetical protein